MLEPRLINQRRMGQYELFVEPMATVWGFSNTRGRHFKMSTTDLVVAFREILAEWGPWTNAGLNQNSVNPDTTLVNFADNHFSPGGHKVTANDQRRGFLHLISSLAYLSQNLGPFDDVASAQPLPRAGYEEALRLLEVIEQNAQQQYQQALQGAQPPAVQPAQPPVVQPVAGLPRILAGIGENLIIYGAPGTGKSRKIDADTQHQDPIRTVFHPDTQNSDFFGSLKPSMVGGTVNYGFAPGPMARALIAAYNDNVHQHFLIIEELNRAPAAAVFGELFQLLDRNPDGSGTYDVDFPTDESRAWFTQNGYQNVKLVLPSNLTILATMNSADQGVHPIDTAFRRRWKQQYMPLAIGNGPQGTLSFVGTQRKRDIKWKMFISILNDHLVETLQVAEDRLFGLWFVKDSELGGSIPDKVLLYLLDDLLRHEGRDQVFQRKISGYGQLSKEMETNKKILSDVLIEKLENAVDAAAAVAAAEPQVQDAVAAAEPQVQDDNDQ